MLQAGGTFMFALVSAPFADLFPQPNSAALRSDELLYGTLVEIKKIMPGSWYYIRTFYQYEGYIRGNCLIPMSHWKKISPSSGQLKLVMNSCCDILSSPSVKSSLLLSLVRGSYLFAFEEETDGYTKVLLFDGRIGYCKSGFLVPCPDCSRPLPDQETAFRQDVIQTALLYLGTQYRWGGKSPIGIDCSGLTFMSYYLNHVIIYRDSLIKPGFPIHTIPEADKKPGDLLYFPGHIALYLGSDQYIHSTAHTGSDGVIISSLNPFSSNYREDLHHSLTAVGSLF